MSRTAAINSSSLIASRWLKGGHGSTNVVEAIARCRADKGDYTDFYDFLSKVDAVACNKKTVESLCKAGAFDSLGHSRKGLVHVHAEAIASAERFAAMLRDRGVAVADRGATTLVSWEADTDGALLAILAATSPGDSIR